MFNRKCFCNRQMGYMNTMPMPQMWGGMNNTPHMMEEMEEASEMGCGCPVVEPAVTKCVQRDFCHQVPHVCPVHTHVVNRHIYNHTYTPQYSCSEENQCINVGNTGCCGF
ncbi:MAG: hypothetical protein ACM3O4_04095 [Ignavibacteriales bacterium]